MTEVTIGNSVTSIGESAFDNCSSIETIYCYAEVPPTIYSNTFTVYVNNNATLHVLKRCKDAYAGADYWRNFKNIVDDLRSVNYVDPEQLQLDKEKITAYVGNTIEVLATLSPDNVTEKFVTWSVSDSTILEITKVNDLSVEVLVLKEGVANIVATSVDGSELTATCEVTVEATLATSITLDLSAVTLKATETATLTATVLPETTTNKEVVWTSSDSEVASVENGVVTAHKVGTVTITATTTDGSGLTATCEVTVEATLATSITLDQTAVILKATETATLTATVLPETTTDKGVEWSSSDESVATVADGVITAHKVGTAIITATTTDGSNLTVTCEVTVEATLATSITLDQSAVTLKATETATLTATVQPETTTNKEVVWTSSDNEVASVENGVVTAHKVGTATITATTTDGSELTATCEVTVEATLATSITLDQTAVTLKATETATLTATVLPETTTNKEVVWTSSDNEVASVENGVVTAHKVGTATITATTTDGSELTATCEVTVEETLATSITLDQSAVILKATETATLTATVLPETTTDKGVVWTSSDNEVASVENGVVTAHKVGTATITATTTDGSELTATCEVTVEATLATSITLDQTNITAMEGETVVLTATIYPDDVTEKGVVWSVSDATIATIEPLDNLSAKITVLKKGVATITAETIDGSNLSATCTIDVYSDIEALLRDSEDVEYYDLNGFRVENPTRGIYIAKHGDIVRKVFVNKVR